MHQPRHLDSFLRPDVLLCILLVLGSGRTVVDQQNPEQILAALQDITSPSMTHRTRASALLQSLGPRDEDAVRVLVSALANKSLSDTARMRAAVSLGCICLEPDVVVPSLSAALTDEKAIVRFGAAQSLSQFGSDSEPASPELKIAIEDDDARVRVASATALVLIGKDVDQAVFVLVEALDDEDSYVRHLAATGLVHAGSDASLAVDKLVRLINDSNEELHVRQMAINVLESIGPNAHPAVPALIDVSSNAALRSSAHRALQSIRYKSEG